MSAGQLLYRILLRAYPPAFRARFKRDMLIVFRDQQLCGETSDVSYWAEVVSDVIRAAPRLWLEELSEGLLSLEGLMRIMAVLTVLFGAFETINSLSEARASSFAARDPLSQLFLLLAIASGLLLFGAGIGLITRGAKAQLLGRIGAAGCLATFALMLAARPMMSVFATLVGIAFPIALLAYLFVKGRPGAAALA